MKYFIAIVTGLICVFTVSTGHTKTVADKAWAVIDKKGGPQKVEIRLTSGLIFVRGVDSDTLRVAATPIDQTNFEMEEPPDPRAQGLRKVTHAMTGLSIWSDRGVMHVGTTQMGALEMHIDIPRDAGLEIFSHFADSVAVSDMNGPVKIETRQSVYLFKMNGEVEVSTTGWIYFRDVFGSLVASTQFGGIEGSFSRLDSEKPVSLSAMEVIDVAIPPKASATLHLKSTWGEIFTDFEMTIHPRVGRPLGDFTVVTPPPAPPRTGMSNPEKGLAPAPDAAITHADIGGGGVEMRLTTVSGNIYVRKKR